MTASPPGSLRTSDWVILNCSFSHPDRPASVHWFRSQGQGRVPVQESPHHHLAESFLFLPQVGPMDSGLWGCILTYRDGFNVSIMYNLTVLGNSLTLLHTLPQPLPAPLVTSPDYGSPNQVLGSQWPTSLLWASLFDPLILLAALQLPSPLLASPIPFQRHCQPSLSFWLSPLAGFLRILGSSPYSAP